MKNIFGCLLLMVVVAMFGLLWCLVVTCGGWFNREVINKQGDTIVVLRQMLHRHDDTINVLQQVLGKQDDTIRVLQRTLELQHEA